MKLSIITTLYLSEPYLREFYERCGRVAETISPDFEIIFVNDGSPDNGISVATSLYEHDRRVKIIDLSRNFGHHKAMMTGLAHSVGQLVFLIDCDLEVKPETLVEFYAKLEETKADVVYGVQDRRHDPLLDRFAAWLFYSLFNWFSSDPLPYNLVTTRLMRQPYVSALVAHQEREIVIAGLWVITGFKQVPLVVTKASKGISSYSFGQKTSVIVNGITSFSNKPLHLIFYLGIMVSMVAGFIALYLVVQRIFFGVYLAGWPSLIVSIWLLGGLTILCLGTIGIYLSKIFTETKQRPYTIIRRIYEHK